MFFEPSDLIFDTLVDTNEIYVSMKNYFTLRKFGEKSFVYLNITGDSQRERINLKIKVKTIDWNQSTQRLKPLNSINTDINLILDSFEAKIFGIKTAYRLSERHLTPSILRRELENGLPRVSFISFFRHALEKEKKFLEYGSYKRHRAVCNKLEKFNKSLNFTEIDHNFIEEYKLWCKEQKNSSTTIAANIASIKKFLRIAEKNGIKFKIDLDEIKTGSTKGNRIALTQNELKKMFSYYKSEFIAEHNRLILGYFLFSCMTGLRISDIRSLKRSELFDTHINFVSQKTRKDQSIALNKAAREIVNIEPLLFEKFLTDQYMNRGIKKISNSLDITKKVSFHTSRHTFATSYLRAGGKLEKLKLLLGHTKLETTLVYSSIVASEANQDVHRLDDYIL